MPKNRLLCMMIMGNVILLPLVSSAGMVVTYDEDLSVNDLVLGGDRGGRVRGIMWPLSTAKSLRPMTRSALMSWMSLPLIMWNF